MCIDFSRYETNVGIDLIGIIIFAQVADLLTLSIRN